MLEIGREDLIREQTLFTQKKTVALKGSPAMEKTKKGKTPKKMTIKTPQKTA